MSGRGSSARGGLLAVDETVLSDAEAAALAEDGKSNRVVSGSG